MNRVRSVAKLMARRVTPAIGGTGLKGRKRGKVKNFRKPIANDRDEDLN
jgi:hypothetical protein